MKLLKIIFCVFLCALFVFTVGCSPEKGGSEVNSDSIMRVHFIDVGQGDSTFIELPYGETMLIDAGEREYGETVAAYIRNLGYDSLTYVIGTHPHSDHIGGLEEVIRGFDVSSVYLPKASTNTKTFEGLLTAISEKGLKINTAKKDVFIIDKDNLQVEILSPVSEEYADLNNYSVVMMLSYFNNRFLFTGDAEKLVEDELPADISCDVLKVGHHGSSTSSSIDFLNSAKPSYAVISCGKDNKYGHPHTEVIDRLAAIGASVLRTDISGNIIIETDRNNIKLSEKTFVQAPAVSSEIQSSGGKATYILNTSSKKIHKPDCGSVQDMREENRAESYESVDALKAKGFTPCGNCKPE